MDFTTTTDTHAFDGHRPSTTNLRFFSNMINNHTTTITTMVSLKFSFSFVHSSHLHVNSHHVEFSQHFPCSLNYLFYGFSLDRQLFDNQSAISVVTHLKGHTRFTVQRYNFLFSAKHGSHRLIPH